LLDSAPNLCALSRSLAVGLSGFVVAKWSQGRSARLSLYGHRGRAGA